MNKPTIVSKPLVATLLAVVATCSVPLSVYASEPASAVQPEAAGDAETAAGTAPTVPIAFPSPEEVVSRLQAKLSLSADQVSAITPIIASRQEKLKAALADKSTRSMKRRRELREIVTESDKQINALLNPEQQKQYAAIEKQMHEELKRRMQERRDAGAG
jgi:hypothetical protein